MNETKVVTDLDIGDGLVIRDGKLTLNTDGVTTVVNDGVLSAIPDGNGGSTSDMLANVVNKSFTAGDKLLAVDNMGQLYTFSHDIAITNQDVSVNIEVMPNRVLDDGRNVAEVRVVVSNNLGGQASGVQLTVGTSATIDRGEMTPPVFTLEGYSRKEFTYSVSYDTSSYITASVNATYDLVLTNNYATASLPFSAKQVAQSESNVYTQECPLVQATYNGEALIASKQFTNINDADNNYEAMQVRNVIVDVSKPNLAGVTINLRGASRVQVYSFEDESDEWNAYLFDRRLVKRIYATDMIIKQIGDTYHTSLYKMENYFEETSAYTFNVESGDLTFNSDTKLSSAIICLRPGDKECLWQTYFILCNNLVTTYESQIQLLATTTLPKNMVAYEDNKPSYLFEGDVITPDKEFNELDALTPNVNVKIFGDVEGAKTMAVGTWNYNGATFKPYLNNAQKQINKRLVVKLCPRNLPVTFEVTTTEMLPLTQGNISIARKGSSNTYTVTVLAGATATDNYTTNALKIILDECSDVVSGVYTTADSSEIVQ